jgi:hypothetical protein
MHTLIFIHRKQLTDGSFVYDVQVGDHTWAAVTEADAEKLADAISHAITDHTNDTAEAVYE